MSPESAPVVLNRGALTICVMFATLLQSVDSTIANVALPYMQAGMSATQSEVGWVLTSYMVAAAIMTPPTGFLAGRFGTRGLFLGCVFFFTIASMLCGLATNLEEIVIFRFLQGMAGASLIPLSQSVLISIYPRERHGTMMALWGMVTMAGPVLGPVLGGWLTDIYSWRAVFYINLPIGVVTFIGIAFSMQRSPNRPRAKLDWFGFATLSLSVAMLQLLVDRGQEQDWFGSTEVCIEAIIGAASFYLFIVHTLTARTTPFISLSLFRDRNFAAGSIFMFMIALSYFASLALQPPYLTKLMGYPVISAGLMLGPRGLGFLIALPIIGRLVGRIDVRFIFVSGLAMSCWALYQMSNWTPNISVTTFGIVTLFQGAGMACLVNPLNVTVMSTLPVAQRTEGAGVYGLFRMAGASIGIAAMNALWSRSVQVNHAEISDHVTPLNRLFESPAIAKAWNPLTAAGQAALDSVVGRQAEIIAYANDYKVLTVAMLLLIPVALVMKTPNLRGAA